MIASTEPAAAAGVFTRNRFVGPSVTLSREHLADHSARAVVIVSKNANVANGERGRRDAEALAALTAAQIGCDSSDVIVMSTGVIGVPYPDGLIERATAGIELFEPDFEAAARGMMTTDTSPKVASAKIGSASIVGIAKGVGMIEPNMATLLAVVATDALLDDGHLQKVFRSAIDRTFNCLSIDTDTSTSDSAVILANGLAGPVDGGDFESALVGVLTTLTKACAIDGEGAETLIEVTVDEAADAAQAKRVAKLIVNSPLVKTAIHGADPNWGRVAMAIGKAFDDDRIDQELVTIRFAGTEVYPERLDEAALAELGRRMDTDAVAIHVSLGLGGDEATVWGCDLTDGYVRINADYTT